MRRYILEYDHLDEAEALLGKEIPYIHLENVTTIIVELYEDEYKAIKEAGYSIKEDVPVMNALLAVPPYLMPNSQNPPTTLFNYYNLTAAHAAGFRGTGVKVGIIDTGCHDNHHAACPAVTRHDFTIEQSGADLEPQPHGGRACIIIGQTNLFTGTPTPGAPALYGMAYECDLHSFRVQENSTAIFASTVIASINYCIANNFDIINLSLSMGGGLDTSVNAAMAAGIIVVCASGNNAFTQVAHPANIPGVLAINGYLNGAPAGSYLTSDGHVQVTLVNYLQGHTSTAGGTSQAAFMASAQLAIYKQKYPSLNTEKAVHLLKRKALPMDGFTYNIPSHTETKDVLENYQTGAGFMPSIN